MTMEKTHFEDTLAADIQLIKDTVLDYIEAWYEGDAPRGEKGLHPQLAKHNGKWSIINILWELKP